MIKEEVELLIKICDFYRSVSQRITNELSCELDETSVEDTLARLKSGEYKIVENKDY